MGHLAETILSVAQALPEGGLLSAACANLLNYCKGAVYIAISSSELDTLQLAFRGAGGK